MRYFRIRRTFAVLTISLAAMSVALAPGQARAVADGSSATVQPSSGPPGAKITGTGTGWQPGDTIQAEWGDDNSNLGSPVTVADNGTFTDTFSIPSTATAGAHQILFWDQQGRFFEVADFTVTSSSCPPQPQPHVNFSQDSGPVGTKFSAGGTGWYPDQQVSISLPYGSKGIFYVSSASWNADSTGDWQQNITVGATPPGKYEIDFSQSACGGLRVVVWFTVTQAGPSVPAAPSHLTATAADPHDIVLNWHDNSDNEAGFEISNGVTSRNAKPGATAFTWGGLAPGTYMCFKIRAYNSAGASAWDPDVSPWYVCATTPKPAQVKYYAAMGDSYSSGLGNPPYPYSTACSESARAYPVLLDAAMPALGKLGFIACAGAVTDDLYTTGKNLSQFASLSLLRNVRTVTLTIGGNDIGFADVVFKCLDQSADCYKTQEGTFNTRLNALAGRGKGTAPGNRPIHALTALLAEIHREAPNAHIFLAGYPRLFGTDPGHYTMLKSRRGPGTRVCYLGGFPPVFVRYDDAQWFNQAADRLNGVLANAAAAAHGHGVPVTFVSVRAAFTTHGDCGSGQSWFTTVNLANLGATLHPIAAGQQAYEKSLLYAGI